MGKSFKWGGILFAIFFVVGLIAIASSDTPGNSVSSPTPTTALPSKEQEVAIPNEFLTHEQLLNISQNDPEKVLGKSFEMDLYLEQQPTSVSAEFITQADTNNVNTILITCNLSPDDLNKLDGASAQKGVYNKTYKAEVTFREYEASFGPYFKGDCALK
jgi:hypothetical protein